ncbi:MAG: hypothetical protein KDB27_28190, partial [Planctomycetales bacterium]|nr:hypothetical protein [Planctomycetales bacterium]
LWFHPHIWWLSQQLSKQRERCCDDIAVSQTDEPIEFANALRKLAHSISGYSALRLAATYDREARIKRLIQGENEPIAFHRCVFGGAGLMAAICCVALASTASHEFVTVSVNDAINPAGGRSLIVDLSELQDVIPSHDERQLHVVLPATGRVAVTNELGANLKHKIAVSNLRNASTLVLVRAVNGIEPFLLATWPTESIEHSDTDRQSGRSGDCLIAMPGSEALDQAQFKIQGVQNSSGRYCMIVWQPRVISDLDADFIGRASSLLRIQRDSARAPAHDKMLSPCIDYPADIDTFQTVTSKRGYLTVTVDGGNDAFSPYVRLFDSKGRLRGPGMKSKFNHVCRFHVVCDGTDEFTRHYIAVSNEDGKSTGRYTMSLAFRPAADQ